MIRIPSSLEPLESRIAPAAIPIVHPLPDIVAGVGAGKTGATIELTAMFDTQAPHANHTLLTFTVNLDSDPETPGIQPSTFQMELFDDEAPLTVQNFLSYVQNPDTARDFLGTFFHRAIAGFVVQGGGFDVSNISKHIPVGPEVHNEFSDTRSNLIGTVAMAKTGLGPNTATSEWFVNLADNSSNLDTQNGGFTVFGQITSGLDVFTKIAALPKTNQGGALTDLPVQNYNSDPDHNPATPPPKPNASQLITITNVAVAPPSTGSALGYTFSVGGNTNPDLVTASIDASNKLHLTYAAGGFGEADVTVHAALGADSADQTIHVKVLPNLIANVATDPLPSIIVPGDLGNAVVKLTNNGAAKFRSAAGADVAGNVDIKFYLSKVTATDSTGTVVDAGDIEVGSLTNQPVNLDSGVSTTFSVPLTVPQQLIATEAEGYHLIAKVTPAAGDTTELFTDDNTAVDGNTHALVNRVGTVAVTNFGSRTIPKLSFTEHDGDLVVVTLKGPGVADVIPDGDAFDLSVTNTSILSRLALVANAPLDPADMTHNGRIELHNTDVTNSIGNLNLAGADINGYTTLSGGVKTLTMGNLSGDPALGDGTLILGALLPANNTPATIKLGQIADYSIESDQPIGTLTAVTWQDTGGDHDHLVAHSIGTLNIKGAPAVGTTPSVSGDLEADVTLEGRTKMSLFRVAGFFQNATFTALKAASVDAVSVGGMQDASFFLGIDARPEVRGDFTKSRSIGTFTVTGAATTAQGNSFIDSQVAAGNIGTIRVAHVDNATGTDDFGFVADTIASYVRDGTVKFTNLSNAQVDKIGHYSVTAL